MDSFMNSMLDQLQFPISIPRQSLRLPTSYRITSSQGNKNAPATKEQSNDAASSTELQPSLTSAATLAQALHPTTSKAPKIHGLSSGSAQSFGHSQQAAVAVSSQSADSELDIRLRNSSFNANALLGYNNGGGSNSNALGTGAAFAVVGANSGGGSSSVADLRPRNDSAVTADFHLRASMGSNGAMANSGSMADMPANNSSFNPLNNSVAQTNSNKTQKDNVTITSLPNAVQHKQQLVVKSPSSDAQDDPPLMQGDDVFSFDMRRDNTTHQQQQHHGPNSLPQFNIFPGHSSKDANSMGSAVSGQFGSAGSSFNGGSIGGLGSAQNASQLSSASPPARTPLLQQKHHRNLLSKHKDKQALSGIKIANNPAPVSMASFSSDSERNAADQNSSSSSSSVVPFGAAEQSALSSVLAVSSGVAISLDDNSKKHLDHDTKPNQPMSSFKKSSEKAAKVHPQAHPMQGQQESQTMQRIGHSLVEKDEDVLESLRLSNALARNTTKHQEQAYNSPNALDPSPFQPLDSRSERDQVSQSSLGHLSPSHSSLLRKSKSPRQQQQQLTRQRTSLMDSRQQLQQGLESSSVDFSHAIRLSQLGQHVSICDDDAASLRKPFYIKNNSPVVAEAKKRATEMEKSKQKPPTKPKASIEGTMDEPSEACDECQRNPSHCTEQPNTCCKKAMDLPCCKEFMQQSFHEQTIHQRTANKETELTPTIMEDDIFLNQEIGNNASHQRCSNGEGCQHCLGQARRFQSGGTKYLKKLKLDSEPTGQKNIHDDDENGEDEVRQKDDDENGEEDDEVRDEGEAFPLAQRPDGRNINARNSPITQSLHQEHQQIGLLLQQQPQPGPQRQLGLRPSFSHPHQPGKIPSKVSALASSKYQMLQDESVKPRLIRHVRQQHQHLRQGSSANKTMQEPTNRRAHSQVDLNDPRALSAAAAAREPDNNEEEQEIVEMMDASLINPSRLYSSLLLPADNTPIDEAIPASLVESVQGPTNQDHRQHQQLQEHEELQQSLHHHQLHHHQRQEQEQLQEQLRQAQSLLRQQSHEHQQKEKIKDSTKRQANPITLWSKLRDQRPEEEDYEDSEDDSAEMNEWTERQSIESLPSNHHQLQLLQQQQQQQQAENSMHNTPSAPSSFEQLHAPMFAVTSRHSAAEGSMIARTGGPPNEYSGFPGSEILSRRNEDASSHSHQSIDTQRSVIQHHSSQQQQQQQQQHQMMGPKLLPLTAVISGKTELTEGKPNSIAPKQGNKIRKSNNSLEQEEEKD